MRENEQTALTELRAVLNDEENDDFDDAALCRFLKANNWRVMAAPHSKLTGAYEQLVDMIKWRYTNSIDTILSNPPLKLDVFQAVRGSAQHGFDADGCPVYIDRTGRTLANEWDDLMSDEEYGLIHAWHVESGIRRMEESSRRLSQPIEQMTYIFDMAGLGLKHSQALHFTDYANHINRAYYPGRVGRVFIINAPMLFPLFYTLAKPFVDRHQNKNTTVLRSNYQEKLLESIHSEDLPEEFGGTCKCEGGCVGQPQPQDVARLRKEHMESVAQEDFTEQRIKPRGKFSHTIWTPVGMSDAMSAVFEWCFLCPSPVDFSVEFYATPRPVHSFQEDPDVYYETQRECLETADETGIMVKYPSRVAPFRFPHRGSFVTQQEGFIRLEWSNRHALLTEKMLSYSAASRLVDGGGGGGQGDYPEAVPLEEL